MQAPTMNCDFATPAARLHSPQCLGTEPLRRAPRRAAGRVTHSSIPVWERALTGVRRGAGRDQQRDRRWSPRAGRGP